MMRVAPFLYGTLDGRSTEEMNYKGWSTLMIENGPKTIALVQYVL